MEVCDVTREERNKSGCAAVDEFTECTTYEIDVDVPTDVAERDPDSTGVDGEPLGEVSAGIRPVTTMVEVTRLIDPAMLVEIEADALVTHEFNG